MAGEPYPKRDKFFANRVIRLLTKTCAAQEIGPLGFALVSVIAMTEDASHYRRAVTWFDGQLLPVVGAENQKQLQRARDRAVAAGWLHYEHGRKAVPGRYWATLPQHANDLDDKPTDEGCEPDSTPLVSSQPDRNGIETSSQTDRNVFQTSSKCPPFLPDPIPVPKSITHTHGGTWLAGPSEAFKRFKAIYPKWSGEADAWQAWQVEVLRLVGERGITDEQAEEILIQGASRYRDSPAGRDSPPGDDFRKAPANWLKGGHHADDDATLAKPNGRSEQSRPGTRKPQAKSAASRSPDSESVAEIIARSRQATERMEAGTTNGVSSPGTAGQLEPLPRHSE